MITYTAAHNVSRAFFPTTDKEMMSKMLERLKKLLNSFSVQRSLSVNFIEQHEIVHLVELRVVREFNLPDNYVNILRVSVCFRI
jgi:hypothetical protein